ncbi:N-formylglutamate amidohydrolase [Neokomagataea tanensis]|uniref:N-formylglutamate amidohydrolase n=1 Tax=Neokomagataea tanensis TaxID=661191 RepID=UPI001F116A3F|nr:N-formylglutamate amidohydrolase [Neokomagataea tanensis]
MRATCLSESALRKTEDRLVDWFWDGISAYGATFIKTSVPRVWCDANRSCHELDERMFRPAPAGRLFERTEKVRAGFGVIPRLAAQSVPIYTHCLAVEEIDHRLSLGWFPYHAALERELRALSTQCQTEVVLLDMHSMPPLQIASRCDIVLGDFHGRACHPFIMEEARHFLEKRGYAVRCNTPYAGGYITQHYGRPEQGRHALQIEVNRACYLNMSTYELSKNAESIKRDLRDMVYVLADHMAERKCA